MTLAGFPHSEIHGSMPACGSPWLIAAYHVLHRLLMPRHPPYALFSLIVFDYLYLFLRLSLILEIVWHAYARLTLLYKALLLNILYAVFNVLSRHTFSIGLFTSGLSPLVWRA